MVEPWIKAQVNVTEENSNISLNPFLVFDREALECSLSESTNHNSSKELLLWNLPEKKIGTVPFQLSCKMYCQSLKLSFKKDFSYSDSILLASQSNYNFGHKNLELYNVLIQVKLAK